MDHKKLLVKLTQIHTATLDRSLPTTPAYGIYYSVMFQHKAFYTRESPLILLSKINEAIVGLHYPFTLFFTTTDCINNVKGILLGTEMKVHPKTPQLFDGELFVMVILRVFFQSDDIYCLCDSISLRSLSEIKMCV